MTHYETLGVSRDATPEEVKKAYRRLAMLHHPDRPGGGNEKKFKEAKEAYETLEDPMKRKMYDSTLPPKTPPPTPPKPPVVTVPKNHQDEQRVSKPEVTQNVSKETKTPENRQVKKTPKSFYQELFTTCLITFALTVFGGFAVKGIQHGKVKVIEQRTVVKGSREDPSMVDFYGEMDLRTRLQCKYKAPGVMGDPWEDKNVGCTQTPNYKKVLRP